MAWLLLVVAGLAETGWAIGLKYTNGFSRLVPSLVTVALMVVSFVLLAHAMRTLPLGTAYTVWVGIGACGAVLAGIVLFGEARHPLRLLCVLLIVAGIVGLRLLEPAVPPRGGPPQPG